MEESEMNICPRCGKQVPAGNVFCDSCGTRLSDAAAPQQQQQFAPQQQQFAPQQQQFAPQQQFVPQQQFAPQYPPPKKKSPIAIIAIIGLAVILAVVLIVMLTPDRSPSTGNNGGGTIGGGDIGGGTGGGTGGGDIGGGGGTGGGGSGQTQTYHLVFHNETGYTIDAILFSSSTDSSWGENHLDGPLPYGGTLTLNATSDLLASHASWDLMVIIEGYEFEWGGIVAKGSIDLIIFIDEDGDVSLYVE